MSRFGPKIGSKSRIGSRNTSGEKYVHYEKSRRKWRVIVHFDGSKKSVGRFDTIGSAVRHRDDYLSGKSSLVEGRDKKHKES